MIVIYPKQINRVASLISTCDEKARSVDEIKRMIVEMITGAWSSNGYKPTATGTGRFICYGREVEANRWEVSVYFTVPTDENDEHTLY